MSSHVKSLGNGAQALASGIVAGVTLVTAYSFIEAWLRPVPPGTIVVMSPADVGSAAFLFSIYYAAVIVLICVPLWLFLSKVGLRGPWTAVLLGFTTTLGYWMTSNYPPIMSARSGLPYALCGAAAGFVTWWRSNRN